MDNKDFLRNFYMAFLKAWNIFFEMPFPASGRFSKELYYIDAEEDDLVIFAIPFVGLLIGFVAFVIIVAANFIFGPIPASIVCSLIVVFIWEILTQGKDTTALVNNLSSRWANFSNDKMKRTSTDTETNYIYIYIFITILAVRIMSLAFLVYHNHPGWIVITAVLIMSVQGHLASVETNDSKEIYVHAGKKEQNIMWVISGIICVIFSGFHILPTICAFALIIFLGIKTKNHLDKNNMLNGEVIGIVGKYTEILVLFIGLVFITYIN